MFRRSHMQTLDRRPGTNGVHSGHTQLPRDIPSDNSSRSMAMRMASRKQSTAPTPWPPRDEAVNQSRSGARAEAISDAPHPLPRTNKIASVHSFHHPVHSFRHPVHSFQHRRKYEHDLFQTKTFSAQAHMFDGHNPTRRSQCRLLQSLSRNGTRATEHSLRSSFGDIGTDLFQSG